MKKIGKIVLKALLVLTCLLVLYVVVAFVLSAITIEQEADSKPEVEIFILTNGVHTDIVMPVTSSQMDWAAKIPYNNTQAADSTYKYIAIGWGDKGFYLETPNWSDLKASVALKAATGLSTTAIHATYYKKMKEGDDCKSIKISKEQYQRLISFIGKSFQVDSSGNFLVIKTNANYGTNDAFYEANGSYSIIQTCNTWANSALKTSGQRCCYWTPSSSAIFSKYK